VLFVVAYWPTHLLLRRLFPQVHEEHEEQRR
jgi:hypothetical protein